LLNSLNKDNENTKNEERNEKYIISYDKKSYFEIDNKDDEEDEYYIIELTNLKSNKHNITESKILSEELLKHTKGYKRNETLKNSTNHLTEDTFYKLRLNPEFKQNEHIIFINDPVTKVTVLHI
ncbi:10373_t:CDS:2, partial [Dentiscutata heterogama]